MCTLFPDGELSSASSMKAEKAWSATFIFFFRLPLASPIKVNSISSLGLAAGGKIARGLGKFPMWMRYCEEVLPSYDDSRTTTV